MANNPYVNKVKLADGTTVMDISDTTATTNDVLSGQVFYTANGTRSIGNADFSAKADKVANATSGNFAGLDSTGNLTDSGKNASDFLTQHQDISGKVDITETVEAYMDLNLIVTSGFYRLTTNHSNAPSGSDYGQMIVSRGGDTIFQTIGCWGTGKVYSRTGNNLGTSSVAFTNWVELTNKVELHGSDQWINGGTSSTQLGVACTTTNNYAHIRADSEGGNLQIRNGNNFAEFDSQPLNDAGTGGARIFVKTGSDPSKVFYFKQDGNFVDGNGLSLGGLNYEKARESACAIVLKGTTSTENVAKGKYVIWDGNLYIVKAAISSGDTLSTSTNLREVSEGGMNEVFSFLRGSVGVGEDQGSIFSYSSNLNAVPDYRAGIKYFIYSNTATNKPGNYGGCGIYLGAWGYGAMLVFQNSSSTALTIYARNVYNVNSTPTFGSWKTVTLS